VNSDCSTWTARSLPARVEAGRGALRGALVTLAGGLLVVVGLVGLFLPAPGVALIALGLSLLSTRFEIARRWLEYVQRGVTRLRSLRR
jgi:Putative transmembrane protein (PGPGW)